MQYSFQEQDLVRVLIKYGHYTLDESYNQKVGDFIMSNKDINADDFQNVLYKKVFLAAYEYFQDNNSTPAYSFYEEHEDIEIRQLCSYVKQFNFIDSDDFKKNVIQTVIRFKLKKLINLCEENHCKIQNASNDTEQLISLLKMQQKLLEVRNDLAKQLRSVS